MGPSSAGSRPSYAHSGRLVWLTNWQGTRGRGCRCRQETKTASIAANEACGLRGQIMINGGGSDKRRHVINFNLSLGQAAAR